MKRFYCALFAVALVVPALAAPTSAVAPRGSIQQAGHVLKKLDVTSPPSYPQEFFSPPPAPGEMGGRERLSDDVADALRVMAETTSTAADYCPPINDILDLATLTTTYFDITRTPNPALDDFKKDWLKVQKQAEC